VLNPMFYTMRELFVQLLGESRLFQNYPEALPQITPYAKVKNYDKDCVVIYHGDAASSLWLVLKGWVKLTRQTPDGKESIIGLCAEGDVFGEAALFPHANYPYHAQTLAANTELAAIPAAVIRALIAENTAFSGIIMSLLNERTSQAQLKLEHMNTMSAAQRLGCFLLRLCHTQASGTKKLLIPVEKHILAAYLGMKPETLSRSQKQLTALGLTVDGHEVHINSIENLRQFVCNSCSESGSCEVEESACADVR